MFWDRLLGGALGLFLAFSAGGKLQLWLDEGKVWQRSKRREPRLLSLDETPFSYVSEIVLYFLAVLFGLALVWWALGGSLKKKS